MVGTIRLNLVAGLFSLLLTFVLSIGHNVLLTTLLRSFYSFVFVFALMFVFRWVLGKVGTLNQPLEPLLSDELAIGKQLDLSTPSEQDAIEQILKDNLNQPAQHTGGSDPSFSPLSPPKLITQNKLEPEHLTEALRRMSED